MVLHTSFIIIRADSLVSELRNASIKHKFPLYVKSSDKGFRHHYDGIFTCANDETLRSGEDRRLRSRTASGHRA